MISRADMRSLSRRYWHIVALSVVFTFARFSEAFLILRANDVGMAVAYVPAVLIVMNVVYAAVAYPAGRAADRFSPTTLLVAGLAVLIAADAALALASTPAHVLVATAAWGVHMGLTQGLFAKLVADAAPASLRGTGFGIFHLASGLSLLMASALAGVLWAAAGPQATFVAGGAWAALAMIGLAAYDRALRHTATP